MYALRNLLKLFLHISFNKSAAQTKKQSYLTWQSKSVSDLQDLMKYLKEINFGWYLFSRD